MGLFGDDDFYDIYPTDLYPEYDFNKDGHIDAFEATEIAAEGFEDHDISGDEGPISELEDYGVDFNSFLAMNDAEKYKILQDAVILNEFDYMEYFDDYDRISGMDEELIELCEYGIDPYDFEDASDDRKYQMLKEAGLDPEEYEEYFDDFDDRELRVEEVDYDNSFEEDDLEDSIIDTSGDDGMNEEKKEENTIKDEGIYKLNGDGVFRAGTDFPAGEIQFRVEWDKKPHEVYYCLVGNSKKRIPYDEDNEAQFSDRLYLTMEEGDYVEFHIIWKSEFKGMYARKIG